MLEVRGLTAFYKHTQAIFDVNFTLDDARCLALVGTNGAGKTTTIRSILGLVQTGGEVLIDGAQCDHLPTHRRVREHKIAVVHEGRGLFPRMTVRENLLVGLQPSEQAGIDDALTLFPMLKPRLSETVSNLSGGQQQMVALGRAVARRPRLLLLDEPSLGLAPVIVDEIYGYLERLRETGLTMLIVEQSIDRAAGFADELCLIRIGRSIMTVAASDTVAVRGLVGIAFEHGQQGGEARIAVSENGGTV
jgi:branched-chain amino acid transport system ATP-binding protein